MKEPIRLCTSQSGHSSARSSHFYLTKRFPLVSFPFSLSLLLSLPLYLAVAVSDVRVDMSAQARLIVVLREKEGIDNDERQRLGESERARGSEKKENRRKSIAVSHYHHRHCRSFALTSLLNSSFWQAAICVWSSMLERFSSFDECYDWIEEIFFFFCSGRDRERQCRKGNYLQIRKKWNRFSFPGESPNICGHKFLSTVDVRRVIVQNHRRLFPTPRSSRYRWQCFDRINQISSWSTSAISSITQSHLWLHLPPRWTSVVCSNH